MARRSKIPTASESRFETLCSDAGVTPQKVMNDENGWDFIVEFPDDIHSGPAEEQPSWKTFYIQVKSITAPHPSVNDLTLSNVRKMAQHAAPWFLVLYHHPKTGKPRVYAKHVWREFIETGLSAVRKADVEGKKLNKQRLYVKFDDEDDHGQDVELIEWMEKTVRDVGVGYEVQKASLYKTVGREHGVGKGRFTVVASSQQQIDRAFLGLDSLEFTDFEFVPARFGIEDPARAIRLTGGILSISPDPTGIVIMRIRKLGSADSISTFGSIFANPLSSVDGMSARVESPLIDLLVGGDGTVTVNASLKREKCYSLKDFGEFAKLSDWMLTNGIELLILKDGREVARGEVKASGIRKHNWGNLASAALRWHELDGRDYTLAPEALFKAARELVIFDRCLLAGSLAIQGTAPNADISKIGSIIYSCSATCGERSISALAERTVARNNVMGGGLHRIEFGEPSVIDVGVEATPGELELEDRKTKFLERLESRSGPTIGIWEITEQALAPDGDCMFYIYIPDDA